jgi:uncharacterized protein YkwD
MRLIPMFLACLACAAMAATLLSLPGGGHAAAQAACDVSHDSLDAAELELLGLINEERAKAGSPPLVPSVALNRAAAWMSQDMVDKGYFAHEPDSLGRSFQQRLRDCGMAGGYWGENLAIAAGPANAFAGWMNSAGHRESMLNPRFRYAGIGHYQGGWTLDLSSVDGSAAAPAPPPANTATTTSTATASPVSTPTPTPMPTSAPATSPGRAVAPLVVSD